MVGYPERVEGAAGVYERWDARRHSEALVRMGRDPEVMRFLGGVQTRAMSVEVSRRIEDHWRTFGFGLWACVDPRDGRCLGFSGACRPGPQWDPPYGGEIEIGWRLARSAWGRGLATDGARLAARALARGGRTRAIAFIDPANRRSQAVAKRLGMRRREGAFDPGLRVRIDVLELALAAYDDEEPP